MVKRLLNTPLMQAWWMLLFLLPSAVVAQQPGKTSIQFIPKNIEQKIQRDAARLALRSISSDGNLESQHILIPNYKIDEIFAVLSTLYKESATVRSLEKCDVHTFPDPSIDRLVVIFKKSARWATSIQPGGGQASGYGQLSALLVKYKLTVEKFVRWDEDRDALVLRAEEPMNMAALAVIFSKIEDVVKVETGVPETTGNDIQARPVPGGWEVTYILRFGAHISGQGKLHTWKFKVTGGNRVWFLGESGDELPAWMDCARVGKE